jgi:hypothetical protein
VPNRPLRPLAAVALLALGDYLLWNWSLSVNRDILALVSGMTLIPLLIACVWLLVLSVARLIARTAQRPQASARTRPPQRTAEPHSTLRDPTAAGAGEVRTTAPTSSKLAA